MANRLNPAPRSSGIALACIAVVWLVSLVQAAHVCGTAGHVEHRVSNPGGAQAGRFCHVCALAPSFAADAPLVLLPEDLTSDVVQIKESPPPLRTLAFALYVRPPPAT